MKIWQSSVLLSTLLSGLAYAQLQRDTDGDGALSLQEFQAAQAERAAQRFARLDADGNGLLTPDELRDGRRDGRHDGMRDRDGRGQDGRGGRGFNRLDTDQDGRLSLAEWQVRHPNAGAELFGELDGNADGLVSREEWAAGRERLAASMRERLATVDTDGDDAWSLAELQAVWPEFSAERFTRLDRDGNGLISADERRSRNGPRHFGPENRASRP